MKLRLLFLLALLVSPLALRAADEKAPAAPPKLKQFIYVLKLAPRLHDDKAWTDADTAVIGQHVANFQAAVKSGQLLLAGRTLEPGDKTFGIAIFTATDEAAADAFMKADPCVKAGIMTATLHPFHAAFGTKI
jgi:uncharacterized protein YciI